MTETGDVNYSGISLRWYSIKVSIEKDIFVSKMATTARSCQYLVHSVAVMIKHVECSDTGMHSLKPQLQTVVEYNRTILSLVIYPTTTTTTTRNLSSLSWSTRRSTTWHYRICVIVCRVILKLPARCHHWAPSALIIWQFQVHYCSYQFTSWRSSIRCCQTTYSYTCPSTWFVLGHLPPQKKMYLSVRGTSF